jgi:hypothetical protein
MRYYEINCDRNTSPDCHGYFGPELTITEAVKGAKAAGWLVGPPSSEDDACPECRKTAAS